MTLHLKHTNRRKKVRYFNVLGNTNCFIAHNNTDYDT